MTPLPQPAPSKSLRHATTSHTLEGRELFMTIFTLLAASYLAMCNQTLVNVVLVQTSHEYGVSLSQANWLVVCVTIVAAPFVTASGSLLNKMGIRNLFFLAFGSSLAGSVLAMAVPGFWTMLAGRCLQAVATGILFPTTTAAILDVSPADKAGAYVSAISIVSGVAIIAAPLVSGVIATYLGLRWIFAVPAALSLVLFPLSAFCMDDMYDRHSVPVDWTGFALVFAGLALVMGGLSFVADKPVGAVAAMVVGAATLALFARHCARAPEPLLILKPFTDTVFSTGEALVVTGIVCRMSLSLLLPIFFEGVFGLTPFTAALVTAIPVAVYIVATALAGKLTDSHGIFPLVPAALVALGAGLLAASFAMRVQSPVATVAFACVTFCGMGFFYAPAKTATLDSVKPELLTEATSINSTMVQVANAIGSALFVGMTSALVAATRAPKNVAYANAVSDTVLVGVGLCAVALVFALVFCRLVKRSGEKV